MSRPAKSLSDRLIDQAKARRARQFPPAAVAELKKIAEYNATAPARQRVRREDIVAMLAADFGINISVETLYRWLRDELIR
jgi:hypothetical protein